MCSSLSAQVGIRTEDPRGMLHVDAKGDTRISVGDTVNIPDDVVVTRQGRIGVGTLTPQARLHIVGPKAIRIADGTQGGGKILTSIDNSGKAHWASVVGSWYATLKGGKSEGASSGSGTTGWPDFTYASYDESSPGSVNLAAGSITIPYTATYQVTVTGRGGINRSTSIFLAFVIVRADGVNFFNPVLHSHTKFGSLNFGFMTQVPLSANQQITMEPSRESMNWANQYTDVMLHIELIK